MTVSEAGRRLADPSEVVIIDSDMAEDPDTDETTDAPDPEDAHVAWAGGHSYVVDNGETITRVDLSADESALNANRDAVRAVLRAAPAQIDFGDRTTLAHIDLIGQAINVVHDAQRLVNAPAGGAAGQPAPDDAGGDEDAELVQPVPNDYDAYDLGELETEIEAWLERYGDFEDEFDPEIVDISRGRVQGEVGFILEAEPFSAGYHGGRGGDWEDQEGFKKARDAFRDLMQGKDPIAYHGEPDYINFLPASRVEEVV